MDEEAIVLCFDGMDINVLQDAMEEREMPNFERLKEEGVLGALTSCHPPVTIPAWMCMFTGKNPGKLGIVHHQELDVEEEKFVPVDVEQHLGTYLWDEDMTAALGWVVGASPPYDIDGRMIEGAPGPGEIRTFPEELKDELFTGEELDMFPWGKGVKTLEHRREKIETVFEVRSSAAHRLAEGYEQDLLAPLYWPADHAAHHAPDRDYFYDMYGLLDEEVGYFLEYAEEEGATLFVVSDHGGDFNERAFFVNTWLEQNGYLKYREDADGIEAGPLLRAANMLIKLGLRKPLEAVHSQLEEYLGTSFKPQTGSVSENMDWGRTQAVSYPIGALPATGIMLNEALLGDDLEEVKEELASELEEEDAVKWARPREEVFTGDRVEELPHLFVRAKDGTVVKAMPYPDVEIPFDKPSHAYYGIMGAWGAGIDPGASIDAQITDVAPTVLHAMGRPVPEDMDGEVLEELFEDDREVEYREPIQRDVEIQEESADDEAVKDRLEELGYMRG